MGAGNPWEPDRKDVPKDPGRNKPKPPKPKRS